MRVQQHPQSLAGGQVADVCQGSRAARVASFLVPRGASAKQGRRAQPRVTSSTTLVPP